MRRFLWLTLLSVFLIPRPAAAQTGSFQAWCEAGGILANISGILSANPLQGSYPKCAVNVYLTGTVTPATIYSTVTLTPLANPFCANSDASFLFFAATSSQYDVVISNSNSCNPVASGYAQLPASYTFKDIGVSGSGSGGGGGGSILLQTNSVSNSSQAVLNLTAGTGITLANPSGGVVTVTNSGVLSFTGATGGARTGALTPLATDYGALGTQQVGTGTMGFTCTSGGTCTLGNASNFLQANPVGSATGLTLHDSFGNAITLATSGFPGIALRTNAGVSMLMFDLGEIAFSIPGASGFVLDLNPTSAVFKVPTTVAVAGVYTNTQMNQYLTSNLGTIATSSEFQALSPGNFATEGITGGSAAGVGATVLFNTGVSGYSSTASTSTRAFGLFGSGHCTANSTSCGGQSVNVFDNTGLTSSLILQGSALSAQPRNNSTAYTEVDGYVATLQATNSAQTFPGAAFRCIGSSNGSFWGACVESRNGASPIALLVGATAATGTVSSQTIQFTSLSSSTPVTATIATDSSGNVVVTPAASQFLSAPIVNVTTSTLEMNGAPGLSTQCLLGGGVGWGACTTASVSTVTGTANQILVAGTTAVTLSLASPLTPPGNVFINQHANGDTALTFTRNTDSAPTGLAWLLRTAGASTLASLDVSGILTTQASITVGANAGYIGLLQGTDNCTAAIAAFSANGVCDEAPATVTASYGVIHAGTGPAAASVKTYTALSSSLTTESFTVVTGNSAHIQTADATVAGAASGTILTSDGSGNAHSSGVNITSVLGTIQGGSAYTNSASNVASTVMTYSNTIPASTSVLLTCVGAYKFNTAVNTPEFGINFSSAPTNLFLNVELGINATTGTHQYGRQTTNGAVIAASAAAAATGTYLPVIIQGVVNTNAATTFQLQAAQVTNAGGSVLAIDANSFGCTVN